jgi:ectoine hydroxylase-related dioxygenase (phytanoyl-CoA dioxygenase family)
MADPIADVAAYDFLSPEQQRAMDQDGCFVVENALPPDTVAEIDAAIDEVYEREQRAGRLPDGGRLNMRNCVTEHDAFLQLIDWPTTFPKAMGILNWNIHLITSHLLVLPSGEAPEEPLRVGLHRDGGTSAREMAEPHPRILFKIGYVISDQSDPASGATVVVPGSNRYLGTPPTDPETGGARGAIPMNYAPGAAFLFEQRTYHGPGHNYSGKPRKTIFIGYGYRWVKPMDYIAMPDGLIDRSNAVQKQLLGVASDALSFYLPQDEDVPLKAVMAERAAS